MGWEAHCFGVAKWKFTTVGFTGQGWTERTVWWKGGSGFIWRTVWLWRWRAFYLEPIPVYLKSNTTLTNLLLFRTHESVWMSAKQNCPNFPLNLLSYPMNVWVSFHKIYSPQRFLSRSILILIRLKTVISLCLQPESSFSPAHPAASFGMLGLAICVSVNVHNFFHSRFFLLARFSSAGRSVPCIDTIRLTTDWQSLTDCV